MKNQLILVFTCITFLLILNSCKLLKHSPSKVVDIDGNTYHTIQIGTQTWMLENLKTTRYRNGDSIPNLTIANSSRVNLTMGNYSNYKNDTTFVKTYGRLYNWYALHDSRNITPKGWHVATDMEWSALTDYLEGYGADAPKLKETGKTHWLYNNQTATNESGFTALPGGRRIGCCQFGDISSNGYWWESNEASRDDAWYLILTGEGNYFLRDDGTKKNGYSVRCVKDK